MLIFQPCERYFISGIQSSQSYAFIFTVQSPLKIYKGLSGWNRHELQRVNNINKQSFCPAKKTNNRLHPKLLLTFSKHY